MKKENVKAYWVKDDPKNKIIKNVIIGIACVIMIVVFYNLFSSSPKKEPLQVTDTTMREVRFPILNNSAADSDSTASESDTSDAITTNIGYDKMEDVYNDRARLIKNIKYLDNSAEFEHGSDIDGLDNYMAEDNFHNVIQIIGKPGHIKEVSWALLPDESQKRTAVSAARLYAFSGLFGGETSRRWVLNRFEDISIDFDTKFADSTVINQNQFIIDYQPDFRIVNLTIRKSSNNR